MLEMPNLVWDREVQLQIFGHKISKLWKLHFYCELVLYFVGHYGPRVASKTFKSFNSTIIDLSLRDNQDVNVKTIIMG